MDFEPQNDFEVALMAAAEDPAKRAAFYQAIPAADFYMVHAGKPSDNANELVVRKGDTLSLIHIEVQGKRGLGVFSSLDRAKEAVQGKAAFVGMKAMAFFDMTRGSDVFLNPGYKFGKVFAPDEINRILDGTILQPVGKRVASKDEQVKLRKPQIEPTMLIAALSKVFAGFPGVERAYIADYFNPNDGKPVHTLVAIEAGGDIKQVMQAAYNVSTTVEVPNPPVDFIQIKGREGVGAYFKDGQAPFYIRESATPKGQVRATFIKPSR